MKYTRLENASPASYKALGSRSYKILEIFCYGGLSPWETLWVKESDPPYLDFATRLLSNIRPNNVPMPNTKEFIGGVHWGPSISEYVGHVTRGRLLVMNGMNLDGNPKDKCHHRAVGKTAFTGFFPNGTSDIKDGGKFGFSARGEAIGASISKYHVEVSGFSENNSYVFVPKLPEKPNKYNTYNTPNIFFDDCFKEVFRGLKVKPVSGDKYVTKVDFATDCGFGEFPNPTKEGLIEATSKLSDEKDGFHICVMDAGLQQNFAQWSGYDGHPWPPNKEFSTTTAGHAELVMNNSRNLFRLLFDDPDISINLENTLVLINTDLGRDPKISKDNADICDDMSEKNGDKIGEAENKKDVKTYGRNHYIDAYVTLLLGGPLGKGRSIGGNIDDECKALPGYNAHDLRAACFMAAGIDPFSPSLFDIYGMFEGKTIEPNDEEQTRLNICRDVFGLKA